MTANEFRRMALALLETEEREHVGHPDFRVGGKIFATLGYPDQSWAMVKLKPVDQARLYEAEPDVFVPFNGAWGRHGATKVILRKAKKTTVSQALAAAWRNVAPKALVKRLETHD
ncbi:MAG TPA: MmcQ/YjbR family DNA-binding protein [Candidatus Acidoferrales bacterium]|nr:MmcQ/YjbR family DNA-binding protein [Candidatus Acidoferrales bacterium]